MEELARLKRAVPVTDTLLVADAMTGQEAVNVGWPSTRRSASTGSSSPSWTATPAVGALSLRAATGKPVRFAGVGEKPSDLEVFHPDRMASRILGMGDVLTLIEKAQASIDQETAAQMERNVRSGRITFDDLLVQMRQLRQMGPLENVVAMLPGAGS